MLRRLTIWFLIAISLVTCSARKGGAVVESHRGLIANPLSRGESAEYFWSKPEGDGPFPLIVFLHGHQEPGSTRIGGRAFVDWGVLSDYAKSGFVALSVSQPGYGGSEGAPDFCGPRTQAAVRTVINHFRAAKFVDPTRIAIEGISRGAVVGAMVAAHDPEVRAVVLIGGVYDLKGFFAAHCRDGAKTAVSHSICDALQQEMTTSDEEFSARSALTLAGKIKAHVLILHGANDQNAPVQQARVFADVLQKAGVDSELHVFPGVNHQIPLAKRQTIIARFLERSLELSQKIPG
jgi:dipeptidyl aminopeptidase/acylaminoacyl peptidase